MIANLIKQVEENLKHSNPRNNNELWYWYTQWRDLAIALAKAIIDEKEQSKGKEQ